MKQCRQLEMKQADRLRKFICGIDLSLLEMEFDSEGCVMPAEDFTKMLRTNRSALSCYRALREVRYRAQRLLWKVA